MDNIQKSILESIDIMAKNAVDKVRYTKSEIGLVTEMKGMDCTVYYLGYYHTCRISTHLRNLVSVGDTVLVQDLYNDNINKYVVSKIK